MTFYLILQREAPSNDVLPHFLLKVTSSAYQQESSTSFVQSHRRETAPEGKDTDDDARRETDVLRVRALRGIKTRSHRGHLICPLPARLCTSSGQQRPPRPGSRAPSSLLQCSCSPSFSFNCFKIMVAVCFACLTDSSGSGWLPPWTLSRFFLILTALLTHPATTDPSAWLLCSSLCSVLCFIHQIVRVSYYYHCLAWWLLFRHYT